MTSYEASVRIGKGRLDEAGKLESAGDIENARLMYLDAKKMFLEAKRDCRDNDAERVIQSYIDTCTRSETVLKGGRQRVVDGQEKSQKYTVTVPTRNFDDVAGMSELKEQITEYIIWPLLYPDLVKKYVGDDAHEGILMYGPPGCGKTYIAEAAAGEATRRCKAAGKNEKVSVLSAKISDVFTEFVGGSEQSIRNIFDNAAKNEPCILFIDELDGLAKTRTGSTTNVHYEVFANEFLMDFALIEGKRVLVMGGTNNPWSVDPAYRREGRISKSMLVPPPDYEARLELFKIYTKNKPIAKDVDYKKLATATKGYSASDIRAICKDAGRTAIKPAISSLENGGRCTENPITQKDFDNVVETSEWSLYNWAKTTADNKARFANQFPDMVKVIDEIIALGEAKEREKKPKSYSEKYEEL